MAKAMSVKKTEAPRAWGPSMDFDRWDRDVERMMNQFLSQPFVPWWPERSVRAESAEAIAPVVDMYYERDDIVIKAELPGMEKDEIQVNLADHLLTIQGEKGRKEKIDQDDYICRERGFGRFSRTLELPVDVQDEKVQASFKNGVLEITLPVAEAAKAKTIKVNVEEEPTRSIGQD
jgi:HSP20 family protein